MSPDCEKDNEKVYGLLHAYIFNVLANQFGWDNRFTDSTASYWVLNNVFNDPSMFTENNIFNVFFPLVRRTKSNEILFKKHINYVNELIHLLKTFHELLQKDILKLKMYHMNVNGAYTEMINSGMVFSKTDSNIRSIFGNLGWGIEFFWDITHERL